MEKQESFVSSLLGENVQKYRKQKNLSQNELAEKIGVSQKHLSDIETGTKFASAPIIEKLSKELGVSVADLFGGTESMVFDISNKVTDLVMENLQPKLNIVINDLNELKKMFQNMRITITTDNIPPSDISIPDIPKN